jgi:apolipoprotein D and lipocalin family protein
MTSWIATASPRRSALIRRILILCLLAGCATKPPLSLGHRKAGAPISSIAAFDPLILAGQWLEVAGYPLTKGCQSGNLTFQNSQVSGQGCYLPIHAPTGVAVTGYGRLTTDTGADLWVLWADEEARTLVIGTPSGAFAAVLHRDGPLPADRLAIAKKILLWNGYDLSGFQGG